MTPETAFSRSSREDNWLPILKRATAEVFEIMLGCQVTPVDLSGQKVESGFTAIVGLAGALCGVVTVCCGPETAGHIAKLMLGGTAENAAEVGDALGELCNMIAGNFKNKLAGTDERCMLSVPSVVSGGEYRLHSLAQGNSMEAAVLLESCPVSICLQLLD